jgi:uncharacterized membrane protein HdeD (DUF308 family)
VSVGHHAGHLVAAIVTTAGLFLAARALDGKRTVPVTRSRREWERDLFGLPSRDGAAALVAARSMPRAPRNPAGAAAALSIMAGAVHLAALPEHISESALFGAFFLLSGAFQIATGFALRSVSSRALISLVAVVNAGIVALWIVSRTKGVPVGSDPWISEPVGPMDLVATACELALIVTVARMRSFQRIRAAD